MKSEDVTLVAPTGSAAIKPLIAKLGSRDGLLRLIPQTGQITGEPGKTVPVFEQELEIIEEEGAK